MILNNYIVKSCGFYVSEYHLAMMLLPYLANKLENGTEINTILNKKIDKEINDIILHTNINEFSKRKLLNVKWTNIEDDFDIEAFMENNIKNLKTEIIINGTLNEIKNINKKIQTWINTNYKKIQNIKFSIINCYEVNEFNSNINMILDEHDYIVNTSGQHDIEELFKAHKRKEAI